MKKLLLSRKAILRAIHAACVALFLAATAAAHAQTAIGDGNGNVTITGSGSNTFSLGPTSSPPLAAGGTLTIAAGANASQPITSTSGYEIQINTVGTTTNSGYVGNANSTLGNSFALAYTSVSTAGNVTVQNTSTGTITESVYGNTGAGIYIQNVTQGSISVTNNGQITVQGDNYFIGAEAPTMSGILANDTYASGTITLTNTGTISAVYVGAENAYGASLATSGAGAITVTNSGTIIGTAGELNSTGINATASGAASISVSNTGTISGITSNTGYGTGLSGSSTSGQITITNSGTGSITGTGQYHGIGIDATTNTGNIAITNENSATVSSQTTGTDSAYYGIGINASSTSGSITINNTASVSGSGYGPGCGIEATVSGAGTVNITNAGTVQGSSSAVYTNVFAFGIYATSGYAGAGNAISIVNEGSGTISASGFYNGTGIYANTTSSGAISITNENSASISGSSDGNAPISIATSYGIHATSASGTITVNNLAGASISASNDASAYGIDASSSGPVNITNNGTIVSTNQFSGIGSAYGIDVTGSSSSVITNTGSITATGSSYGIVLNTIGQVRDSGFISAITAISVPSGSSVTLTGRPTINGAIVGGPNSASTSQLIFAQTVSSANLAAAKAELNTEIAQYAAQDGGSFTFSFDSLSYSVLNFDYDGGVIVDLTAAAAARLYQNTPGFYNEGLVLDTLPTGNAVATRLLNALGNVPDAGVAHALAELSPKELEIFRNVAFDNNTFTDSQINNHLANLRDGLTGFDSSALTVQDSTMDPTLNQVRDHLLAYNPASTPGLMSDTVDSILGGADMKSAQVNTMPVDRWSTFIAGNVILADLSNNLNLPDSNYTTGAVTAGADYRLDEHFTVGALFAYAHTDAGLDDRGSSAKVDSYSPGIYASYVDGPWYGNFEGAYTRNSYTEDREIDIVGLGGDNHGSTNGDQGSANLTGGYEFQKGAFKFGPVASLQYVHLAVGSIQEQGPTALDINSQDQDSLRSLLGFEGRFNANVATPLGPVSLTPHLSANWQHEYLDNGGGITSQFTGAGGGSFATQTDSPDRDSAFIDAGLDATVSKNVTVFVDYEVEAGQQDYFAQSAEGGVRIGF